MLSLTKNPNLAEELTQEAFFKAFKNFNKYDENKSIYVWLCQIGKNTYFSYLKKENRFEPDYKLELLDSEIDIEADFLKTQDNVSIHKIIHTLNEPYKEVFNLRLFGELSFKQIGEILGKSETWAKVTYFRAKAKIKSKYSDKEN